MPAVGVPLAAVLPGLVVVHGYDGATPGLYCSLGGVANQQRIDAITAGMTAAGCSAVIAVDNDKAGEDCRQRNPDLSFISCSRSRSLNGT